MKFGDTLQQRSVPQWQNYNIDYTALKRLIKNHTSPSGASSPGTAVAIPGKGPTAQDTFDTQLLELIRKECDRLDLFVKSKKYELASRLQSIDRQIQQLQQRRVLQQQQSHPSSRTALSLRRRFSKLESELLQVGEEIQNVSRFIVSNRMAIRKAIKKHRKWTRSSTFAARVEEQVLRRDDCFTRVDLASIMEQYAGYLDDLRAAFQEHDSPRKQSLTLDTANPSVTFPNTPVEFDTSIERDSPSSRKATYWVHQDNIVELRVLLLQYMRYAHLVPNSATAKQVLTITRRDSSFLSDEHFGKIALDDFGVSAYWAGNDAAVVLSDKQEYTAKIDRRHLPALLDASRLTDPRDSSDELPQLSEDPDSQRDHVKAWFENHADVKPLARICSKRSRFVSLEDTTWPGPRAVLDQDVRMERTSIDQLKRKEYFKLATMSKMDSFPHAVLTVVCGTDDDESIVAVLDATHLTERIDGFSLSLHAIATCCKPNALPDPPWLPKMSADIRHLPPASEPSSRRSSTPGSPVGRTGPANPRTRSATTPSFPEEAITPEASATRGHDPRQLGESLPPKKPEIRYWNEFDNGSEFGGNDDSYVIYVDPNEPVFPGLARFIAWQKNLYSMLSKASSLSSRGRKKEQGSGMGSGTPDQLVRGAITDAQTPIYYSTSDEENDDTDPLADSGEDDHSPTSQRRHNRNERLLRAAMGGQYGTMPSSMAHQGPLGLQRTVKPSLRTPTISLAASAMVTLLLSVMSSTARKGARGEVSVAVLLGVAASLIFAVLGVVGLLHAVSTVGEPRDLETLALLGAVVPAGQQISWQKKVSSVGKWRVGLGLLVAICVAVADGVVVAIVLV